MKKTHFKFLTIIPAIAFATISIFTGCEGPAGEDGKDANATCVKCHNLATQDTIYAAYLKSGHAAGTTVGRSSSKSCAPCHSHEGAVETARTGRDTTAAGYTAASAISCETCHDFHETLDQENEGPDYALRFAAPVKLLIDKDTELDLGTSNTCAKCHQPRTAAPVDDGNGNAKVTSVHYGPHYGTPSTVLAGLGA